MSEEPLIPVDETLLPVGSCNWSPSAKEDTPPEVAVNGEYMFMFPMFGDDEA